MAMDSSTSSAPSTHLIPALHRALEALYENPPPSIPSPATTPKRASVALVIRIQPHPSHRPNPDENNAEVTVLSEFFDLPWVQHGDPECLFIKRAARKGDRWTSHVALPGGKRDAEDKDDYGAAVRECLEEVGLDLDGGVTIDCGKLPDRVVTTSWGNVPLMVLCPFVFLHTSSLPPPFHLQPTEVASAHWVPLRTLLSPNFRTVKKCDVSDRLARQRRGVWECVTRWGLRLALGQMEFSAIRLWPSISVFASFGSDFLKETEAGKRGWERPLLLWGLTLGVVTDFFEMLPLDQPIGGWNYPTFSGPDVKAVVWLMTRSLRKRNWEKARLGSMARTLDELEEGSMVLVGREESRSHGRSPKTSTAETLIDGYDDVVKTAVWVTLLGRAIATSAALGTVWWRYGKSSSLL